MALIQQTIDAPSELPREWARQPNRLLGTGAIFVVLGALAIILPVATTIGVELALGALLMVAGGVQILGAASAEDGWGIAGNLGLGALSLALGLLFMLNPLQGILALTLFIGAMFVASAVFKFATAYRYRAAPGAGWAWLSGITSLAVGLLIMIGWPEISAWVLGLLFGIDLLFFGAALLALGFSLRADQSGEHGTQGEGVHT